MQNRQTSEPFESNAPRGSDEGSLWGRAALLAGTFVAGALSGFTFGNRDREGVEERFEPVAPPVLERPIEPEHDEVRLAEVAISRIPVSVETPAQPEPPPVKDLSELSCTELRIELARRLADLKPAFERAATECGFSPAEIVPWGLKDQIVHTTADAVREAVESGDMDTVAEGVGEQLLEVRAPLVQDLKNRLQIAGVAPVHEVQGLKLPENFGPIPKQEVGAVRTDDGKLKLYFLESALGATYILPVPEQLEPLAQLVYAIRSAEQAADRLYR